MQALRQSEHMSKQYVSELLGVDQAIRNRVVQITGDKVKLAMIRRIGNIISYHLVYEVEKAAYRVEVVREEGNSNVVFVLL